MFDASSLEYTNFSFFLGNGMPVRRSGKSEPGPAWGKGIDRGQQQSKVKCFSGPIWPPGTQKTSFFPGSLLPEVTAKKLRMHPEPVLLLRVLGWWEMIQASLYCASSVSGQHAKHPHMKSMLEWSVLYHGKGAFSGSLSGRRDGCSLSPSPSL